jgi:hypothetical protein
MISPTQIETQICQKLHQSAADLWAEGHTKNTPWTKAIKKLLRDFGWELGYDVCTGGYEFAARATHRLMISQCRTKFKEERLQYFRDAVKVYRHRQPGDRYLIALLDVMDATYHFELIVLTDPDTVEIVPIEISENAII